MTQINAKQAAGLKVIEAVEGLNNGDIMGVLASVAAAQVAGGAQAMGMASPEDRKAFIGIGEQYFKSLVTTAFQKAAEAE